MILLLLLQVAGGSPAAPYDPLAPGGGPDPEVIDLTVQDDDRDRAIPIRVFLPPTPRPAPVVLFSHGLGGSREGNAYLGVTVQVAEGAGFPAKADLIESIRLRPCFRIVEM